MIDKQQEADIIEDYLKDENFYYKRTDTGGQEIIDFTFGNQDAEFVIDERGTYLSFYSGGISATDEYGPFEYAEEAIDILEDFR